MKRQLPIILSLVLLLLGCSAREELPAARFLSHDLIMDINLETHQADIADRGQLQAQMGWNVFELNSSAVVAELILDGDDAHFETLVEGSKENAATLQVKFQAPREGTLGFEMRYVATFFEDVADIQFSNQKVGKEVTGTILDQGIYLSPSAFYYARGNDSLMSFEISALLPEGYYAVSDGNPIQDVQAPPRPGVMRSTWRNPYLSDGLMFMAAPFEVATRTQNGVTAACYFFPEDTARFDTYLDATLRYLEMYSELIGPYPYTQFSVVENFFPTGYGMPGWTLLGQEVLRLPFIVMTSLGHEVLHNWWGNSVYVDYDRGNWCEGSTVYGADYHYKELRSAEAARDYRKDVLKQYKSYVNAGNEFPLREFTSRSESHERTIGYNKAMMVYHMIRQEIGDEAFWATWKDVYREHIEEQISWEEWVAAFEKRSGKPLDHIIPQWIDRTGALQLDLAEARADYLEAGDRTEVSLTIVQPETNWYRAQVPIRFHGAQSVDTTLWLDAPRSSFVFKVVGRIESVELDPDYHVFRNLYPEEMEPIVALVLGSADKHFVTATEDANLNAAFKAFAENMTEDEVTLEAGTVKMKNEGGFAPILLNPVKLPASLLDWVALNEDTIEIDGKAYPRKGHTFILTAEDREVFARYMVVISEDAGSLPRVGELIPHYGKYSYLVFKGSRNVGKGQWPSLPSPLNVVL